MRTPLEIMSSTPKKLFWAETGRIGCDLKGHAPFVGTDTWRSERWRPITFDERLDYAAEMGVPPACEVCQAELRVALERGS